MKKIIRYITFFTYYIFHIIDTCEEAKRRGLMFDNNVFGDEINHCNCRSFWYDEYNLRYRCSELYKK